jgi:bacterioferritin-associated ferredoxin
MIVCLCHRVSERDIHVEVAAGTRCFEVLQDETRVASSCGCCHDCAREVFDDACARQHCQATLADEAVRVGVAS